MSGNDIDENGPSDFEIDEAAIEEKIAAFYERPPDEEPSADTVDEEVE